MKKRLPPRWWLRSSAILLTGGASFTYYARRRFLLLDDISDGTKPLHSRTDNGSIQSINHVEKSKIPATPDQITLVADTSREVTAASGQQNADISSSTNDESAWAFVSSKVDQAASAVNLIPWSALGEAVTGYIFPPWARLLPDYAKRLQRELIVSGSLADEIWQEAQDVDINPEIAQMAIVRIGKDLCPEEEKFLQRRKHHTMKALAKYLGLAEDDIHPEDVPTIAICTSGGGLRAMVAGCGSMLGAQKAGLLDCVTYTAGVSGSCWLQALYYSSIGGQKYDRLIKHFKNRLGTHIAFPPTALELVTSAPTNKFLLSGFVEKLRGDAKADFGLVDIYGLLLASRLFVPRGELEIDDRDLKMSNQRAYLCDGQNPLPVYTAVRHEIPKAASVDTEAITEKVKQEAWFQWFELSPYELFCEELDAGIPSWGVGRPYRDGQSVCRENGLHLPEYRIPLMLGIWGSAFCATLAHYYKEIRPVLKGMAGFGAIDDLFEGRNDDLTRLHLFEPASIPNYLLGLQDQLPSTCPQKIFESEHLQLADAGMSNNLPLYPLLRQGRDVDIIIAFDNSADVKGENWLPLADGYARQRGVTGWPMGTGWPKEGSPQETVVQELDEADARSTREVAGKLRAEVKQGETYDDPEPSYSKLRHEDHMNPELGYCNVWVGTALERTSEDEPPKSKLVKPDEDWELLSPNAGIALIYFPFLPNPKVQGIDPSTTEFLSTWNFIYSPDNVDQVVALARTNFEAGKEQTKRTIRAVYERKKAKRIQMEEEKSRKRWLQLLKDHGDHFR